MAYGYNLRQAPFGFPVVNPWPQGFQPLPPPAPIAPRPEEDPMAFAGGGAAPGGVPAPGGGPMFPGLAARFPRLAQAGQRVGQFFENFEERRPRIANFARNNSDMLSNVGMALLTTRPGDNAPVREAFYYGRQSDQERRAEAAAAAQEQARRDSLRQLIMGGASGAPGGVPATPAVPGREDGSWMLAGSGATGTNNPPEIVYANQNAIRNDPIAPALQTALQAAAAEAGIDRIVVVSGGQEAEGEGSSRTGSTRHDHGNAADVDLYVGGRRLDFNNPQDQAIYQQFVAAAVRNGVTGIGAGEGYMGGNGRIHVGFGTPAVWGAGGSSANAPEWLRTAYSGAGGGGQGTPAAQGGINGLSPDQQRFAMALLDINPEAAEQYVMQAMLARQEQRPLMNLDPGDTVWNPNTGQAVFTAPQAPGAAATTDDIREFEYAKRNEGYTGTLEQWIHDRATAARPQYYENAYDRVTGEFNAESLNTIYQNETLAIDRMTNLGLMEQLVNDPTFYSGTGANVVEGLRRFAAAIGVADPAAAVSMETFRALANEATLDAIGGSLGVGISNADRDMIRQMVANMTFSPEGNRLLINIHQAVANRNLEIAELARQYTADPAHPRLDDGFRRMLTEWANENPLVLPGTEGAAAPGTPEAPRPIPQVGEVVDGYRFLGGDPNNQANWQRVN